MAVPPPPWPPPIGPPRTPPTRRVLVVCTANVCRSPVAERLLRRTLADMRGDRGERWEVSSAGTLASGAPPDQRTWRAAAAVGVDLHDHLVRQVDRRLLSTDGADLVLTMERAHLRMVTTLDGRVFPRTFTLKELVRRAGAAGPGTADEPFERWLQRAGVGRVSTQLLGSSALDDVADPYGRPQPAHDAMVAEITDLVAELGRLGPWREALVAGSGGQARPVAAEPLAPSR